MRLTTSPHSCAESHEIWGPKPPGTFWATPALLRDSYVNTVRNNTGGFILIMIVIFNLREIYRPDRTGKFMFYVCAKCHMSSYSGLLAADR